MQPYFTVPFKFTPESWEWLTKFIQPIVVDFQDNAPRVSALLNLTNEQLDQLLNSMAWKEIVEFADNCNLSNPFPQLFIYKHLDKPRATVLGNPHIDSAGAGGVEKLVSIRFNLLLNGADNTEMVWWDIDRSDERIINHEFERPDRSYTGRLQARGKNLQEQWANVGNPAYRARDLAKTQEYASFVRTDRLHALNWTGRDARLIFSVKFDNSWDDIEALRHK